MTGEHPIIDALLLLGPWRPVDLLPQGEVANGPLVMGANRASSSETSGPLTETPAGPLQYAAFGNPKEVGDYLEWNSGGVRLVSGRFRRLLEDFGQRDAQFFAAEIETGPSINSRTQKHGGGPVLTDFWWMHHWRRHDLVDVPRSTIRYRPMNPPAPIEQCNIDVDRSELLTLRAPPEGEGLYGLRGWPGYRIVTPALAAHIRDAALKLSLFPRALTPDAKARFQTGLFNELRYLPEIE